MHHQYHHGVMITSLDVTVQHPVPPIQCTGRVTLCMIVTIYGIITAIIPISAALSYSYISVHDTNISTLVTQTKLLALAPTQGALGLWMQTGWRFVDRACICMPVDRAVERLSAAPRLLQPH